MNQVVLTLLCALVFGVTLTQSAGQAGGLSERCLCSGKLLKAVNLRWIHAFEFFPPSPICSKMEIILTVIAKGKGKGNNVKRRIKVCLDPNERQGQRLLKVKGIKKQKAKEQRKKRKD